MELSERGLALIEASERLRTHAYQDSVGVWTIGYGHTSGVEPGQVITQEQAEQFLKDDVRDAESAVNRLVRIPITQGQFDALVDFTFNLGSGSLARSTLLRKLNTGDISGAAREFGRWVYAGGKKLNGLVTRRAKEKALFEGL